MSTFIKHTSCSNCGSKDNLAIYTDHEYCFGCGYIKYFNGIQRVQPAEVKEEKIYTLPLDIEPIIPVVADSWLRQYGLTSQELIANRVVWSEYKKLLIFPYFDDKNYLWGWQGRYFGDDSKHPKWTSQGKHKELIKISNSTQVKEHGIILVEDIISYIKVSRIYSSSCLYGSSINYNKYINIYNTYKPKEFILWLDKDKSRDSYIYSYKLNNIGINCRTVVTELDPKEYTSEQIRRIIEPKTTDHTSSP